MTSGMAPVTECDEIPGIVEPASRAGNEMVNVELTRSRSSSTQTARILVARQHDRSDSLPLSRVSVGRQAGRKLLRGRGNSAVE
jgi:hypothetical protein